MGIIRQLSFCSSLIFMQPTFLVFIFILHPHCKFVSLWETFFLDKRDGKILFQQKAKITKGSKNFIMRIVTP
ncbi:hypothetical protein L6452_10426 [Arctium lappa]|uniref:Uncharacterized protein n=1 Tax=Arctium lappa TaxID=4217 RepID=A0ACB9DMT0_ARCLA|nr:hypothetical protein L6452_10426 [Arctium lappa]